MVDRLVRPDDIATKMAQKIESLKEARKALDIEIKETEKKAREDAVNAIWTEWENAVALTGKVISEVHEKQAKELIDKIIRHDLSAAAYGLPRPPSPVLEKILNGTENGGPEGAAKASEAEERIAAKLDNK